MFIIVEAIDTNTKQLDTVLVPVASIDRIVKLPDGSARIHTVSTAPNTIPVCTEPNTFEGITSQLAARCGGV
ncbi:MAG: hypothetical protein AAFU85_13455 [Planctomycetota bacterium]